MADRSVAILLLATIYGTSQSAIDHTTSINGASRLRSIFATHCSPSCRLLLWWLFNSLSGYWPWWWDLSLSSSITQIK